MPSFLLFYLPFFRPFFQPFFQPFFRPCLQRHPPRSPGRPGDAAGQDEKRIGPRPDERADGGFIEEDYVRGQINNGDTAGLSGLDQLRRPRVRERPAMLVHQEVV